MTGAICKWDILAHPIVTIRSFGWRVFWRALLARRSQTFLSLLAESGAMGPSASGAADLFSRSIEMERRAMHVYQTLAPRFLQTPAVQEFLETLARHEQGHADLLTVCRAEARRARRDVPSLEPLGEALPRVDAQIRQVEDSLAAVRSTKEALRAVLAIESSEINRVFCDIVAASDSPFVRSLRVFRTATQMHLAYLQRRITQLDPSLEVACEDLALKHTPVGQAFQPDKLVPRGSPGPAGMAQSGDQPQQE